MDEQAEESCDLLVIGGGPGGYVTAIRAGQLGKKVICVDARPLPGGTCLHEGCIPSKTLLDSSKLWWTLADKGAEHGILIDGMRLDLVAMQARKERVVMDLAKGIAMLCKKQGVSWRQGVARLLEPTLAVITTPEGATGRIRAQQVILATGAKPMTMAELPVDGERILDSRHLLQATRVPDHLVVVGGGAIGLELGSIWLRLGAQVTVVESLPEILPQVDVSLVRQARRIWRKQGLRFLTATRVEGAAATATGHIGLFCRNDQDELISLLADQVLVAIGRRPIPVPGAVELGLALTPAGRVAVDAAFRTNLPELYAIGDLIEGPMLAHRAMEEGVILAESLAGRTMAHLREPIPSVIYTHPEIAMVGWTEAMARSHGVTVKTGQFPMQASGRARTAGEADGLVKLVVDGASDRLLGVHILAPQASEMIVAGQFALAAGWTGRQIADRMPPHPSLGEAIKEAALAIYQEAIHL